MATAVAKVDPQRACRRQHLGRHQGAGAHQRRRQPSPQLLDRLPLVGDSSWQHGERRVRHDTLRSHGNWQRGEFPKPGGTNQVGEARRDPRAAAVADLVAHGMAARRQPFAGAQHQTARVAAGLPGGEVAAETPPGESSCQSVLGAGTGRGPGTLGFVVVDDVHAQRPRGVAQQDPGEPRCSQRTEQVASREPAQVAWVGCLASEPTEQSQQLQLVQLRGPCQQHERGDGMRPVQEGPQQRGRHHRLGLHQHAQHGSADGAGPGVPPLRPDLQRAQQLGLESSTSPHRQSVCRREHAGRFDRVKVRQQAPATQLLQQLLLLPQPPDGNGESEHGSGHDARKHTACHPAERRFGGVAIRLAAVGSRRRSPPAAAAGPAPAAENLACGSAETLDLVLPRTVACVCGDLVTTTWSPPAPSRRPTAGVTAAAVMVRAAAAAA